MVCCDGLNATGTSRIGRGGTRRASVVVAILGAGLLGSCSGAGSPTPAASTSPLSTFFRGSTTVQTPVNAALPETARCPPVQIQPETESLRRDDGSGDPTRLRWQASILKTARECSYADDGVVTMRVGLSGQIVQGAAGTAGAVELPVRIAVREGETVTYNRLHSVTTTVAGASDGWAYVEEGIVVRAPNTAVVLVGFDG